MSEQSAVLGLHHRATLLVVVPDVDTFHQKQHVFGDIRRVIGNALQVSNRGE